MLTPEERDRLVLEEALRYEIREQIASRYRRPKTGWEWASEVANMPFVLWVLSSLVVGVFGWLYARYDLSKTREAQIAEIRRKIDVELVGRAEESWITLYGLETSVRERQRHYSPSEIFTEIVLPLDNAEKFGSGIYPEFRERSYHSLLTELKSLLGPHSVDSRFEAYGQLRTRASGTGSHPNEAAVSEDDLRSTWNTLQEAHQFLEILQEGETEPSKSTGSTKPWWRFW